MFPLRKDERGIWAFGHFGSNLVKSNVLAEEIPTELAMNQNKLAFSENRRESEGEREGSCSSVK